MNFNTDILNYISTTFTAHKVWVADTEYRSTYLTDDYIKLNISSGSSNPESIELQLIKRESNTNVAIIRYTCGANSLERPIYFRDLYNLVDNITLLFVPYMLKIRD